MLFVIPETHDAAPPPSIRSSRRSGHIGRSGGVILYGVAGWSYADWRGPVYPRRASRAFHALTFLARFIDLMEINSTFYALPQARHANAWVTAVEATPAFRFTAKLHRSFTHGPAADFGAGAAATFRAGIAPLKEAGRLLGLLVQFPVTFHEDEEGWARLERIRALFPDETLVLELRHRRWFEARAFERLADLGYGVAHLDLPAARDHPPSDHGSLAGPAYLRLHGRNAGAWFDAAAGRDERYDYRYGPDEIRVLSARLQTLAGRSEKALLVANNHFGGQALAAALEIKGRLAKAQGDEPPLAPAALLDAFPDLQGRLRPTGQMGLF